MHSETLGPTLWNVGTYPPKRWGIPSETLGPTLRNVGTYPPKCWNLPSEMLEHALRNVRTYPPKRWYIPSETLEATLRNADTYPPKCWNLLRKLRDVSHRWKLKTATFKFASYTHRKRIWCQPAGVPASDSLFRRQLLRALSKKQTEIFISVFISDQN